VRGGLLHQFGASAGPNDSVPSPEGVRVQLDRILSAKAFVASERLSKFLRFTVEETLAGDGGELKESVIGVQVFERGASYDPRIDPIVRVMAGRLRLRLDAYYATEGRDDRVIIQFPKGSYVPRFRFPEIAAKPSAASAPQAAFLDSRWLIAALVLLAVVAGSAVWLASGNRRQLRSQEAHRLYARGEGFAQAATPDSLQNAIQYFNLAAAADPSYALPHASLSLVYIKLAEGESVPAVEALQQAKAHAEEALRRDDSLAESHLALAEAVLLAEYDWERANGEFQRALAIDPAYSDARYNYAHMCLSPLGRYDQAARLLEEGLKKDPFSSKMHTELANIDLKRGRIDEAVERFRQNLARHPDAPGTLTNLAIAIQKQSHFAEALSYLARARRASPSDPWIAGHMAVCYIRLGRRAEAHTILEELTSRGGRTATPECSIASIYAALGNFSAAFEHLERAFALHSMQMLWLKVDPRFEPLRSDPRFAGLLASLRLR
jgi:tetratricopeptide (TPR) repeat protein